jgi:hypothetical protein
MNLTSILFAFASVWKSVHGKNSTYLRGLQSLGDWEFCSSSSQCSNGCCSNVYSDDGALKCTPLTGGFNPDICLDPGSEPAPIPPSPTPPTSGEGANDQWLQAHNKRREAWHTQYGYSYIPLQWNTDLETQAKAYAEELLSMCGVGLVHGKISIEYSRTIVQFTHML